MVGTIGPQFQERMTSHDENCAQAKKNLTGDQGSFLT
jgi:hypothetical protein